MEAKAGALSRRGVAFTSLCIAFFGVGAIVAALGPVLPELAARNGLPLTQAGLVVSFIFFGSGVTSPIAGALSDCFGRGPFLILGVLCTAVFAVGVTMSRTVPLLLVLSFGMGIGTGIVIVGTNVLVVDLFGERSVSTVNLVNMFFGVGAVTGPLLASLAFRRWQTAIPAIWLGVLIVLTQFPILLILQRRLFSSLHASGSAANASAGGPASPHKDSVRSIFRSPLLWMFGTVILFDLGMEQSLNAWTPVYKHRSTGVGMADAALVVSGFWIAFTIGRLTAAAIANRVSPKALLRGSLFVAAVGVVLINLASGTVSLSTAGFMLMGLGFGPIFPTVASRIATTFRRTSGAATGIAVLVGTVGGILFAWLVGFVLGTNGPPSAAPPRRDAARRDDFPHARRYRRPQARCRRSVMERIVGQCGSAVAKQVSGTNGRTNQRLDCQLAVRTRRTKLVIRTTSPCGPRPYTSLPEESYPTGLNG